MQTIAGEMMKAARESVESMRAEITGLSSYIDGDSEMVRFNFQGAAYVADVTRLVAQTGLAPYDSPEVARRFAVRSILDGFAQVQ